jgi:uncharacterized membrane protein
LAGGAAGAYATVSPRLNTAFIGVAIATALVPPLCAASILLSRGEFELAFGAFSLALINMVAIQFSFVVVLWCSGFRRVSNPSGMALLPFLKRNAASILVLVVLAVVLSGSLHRVIERNSFEAATRLALRDASASVRGGHLVEARFQSTGGTTIVRAVMRGPTPPTAAQVVDLEGKLPRAPDGTAVELRVRFVLTSVIGRDGLIENDQEAFSGD